MSGKIVAHFGHVAEYDTLSMRSIAVKWLDMPEKLRKKSRGVTIVRKQRRE